MRRQRQYPGSRNSISAGDWNGFLDMYNDYVTGSIDPTVVPPMLKKSIVVDATVAYSGDSIPAYTPCRIVKSYTLSDNEDGETKYKVLAVDVEDEGFTGNYGFTLSEGVDNKTGGRIVIGGIAIVKLTRDQVYDGTGAGNTIPYTGQFDSMWYNVPDKTVSNNVRALLGPVGHYKLISFYTLRSIETIYPKLKDMVFLAIDMNTRPDRITIKLGTTLGAASGTAPDRVFTQGTASVVESTRTRPIGGDITTTENVDFEMNVYNPTAVAVDPGAATATFSKQHNCFLIDIATEAIFVVELDKQNGAAGDASNQCNWRYDVRKLGDTAILAADLDVGLPPNHYKRPAIGAMTEGTFGLATYDGEDLVIISTNEVFETSTC